MQMPTDLIHERGRGPELLGTRITVYNLLPHFLDPAMTEAEICRFYELTSEQVAAARAYVLNNVESVFAEHLKIEARMAAGNPPDVMAKAKETHATFLRFKDWLAQREECAARRRNQEETSGEGRNSPREFTTFIEWLAEQRSRPEERS
jgi:uncharacterized protein (DUF433 family)